MEKFSKPEAEALVFFLKDHFPDDILSRVRSLLTGGEAEDRDLSRSHGLDSTGRRLVRPATEQARKAFDEKHGITTKRIRVLG